MVQSSSLLTLPSLVWSLHDVLHVACQSSPYLLPFFFSEETPWIYMHSAGVKKKKKKRLHLCYFMLSNQVKSAESVKVDHFDRGQC